MAKKTVTNSQCLGGTDGGDEKYLFKTLFSVWMLDKAGKEVNIGVLNHGYNKPLEITDENGTRTEPLTLEHVLKTFAGDIEYMTRRFCDKAKEKGFENTHEPKQ